MLISREESEHTALKVGYARTTSVVDGEDDLRYTTYGIVARDERQNIVARIDDVSTDLALVDEIVARCNANDADILHLEDIVLDWIG